jgi:anti-sigma factor RsiW
MTAAQNIELGNEKLLTRFRTLNIQAQQLLQSLNFHVDPAVPVASLGAAKRQMVEIARAVYNKARIIIFDEPTATLYYENVGGTRVTVFVFDPNRISVRSSCCLAARVIRKNGEERTVLVGHAKGYSLAVAERDGVGYALSGDLGEPEMVNLASNF